MEQKPLIFVTGGVRSGKSTLAEKLAAGLAREIGGRLHYVACGRRTDGEMEARIIRHQKERENGPLSWKTWERPDELAGLRPEFTSKDVILLDCLTTLLDNELFAPGRDYLNPRDQEEVRENILSGIDALWTSGGGLVIVSNEVFYERIGQKGTEAYCKLLGSLHGSIAERSAAAVTMEAGLPILMKGSLEGMNV